MTGNALAASRVSAFRTFLDDVVVTFNARSMMLHLAI
jgi:hypothetical protein